jgi:hypothetical protein
VRAIEDRHPSPSAAILDSQSVETATMIHYDYSQLLMFNDKKLSSTR